ncbi:hypothetical protein Efla_006116 [Eimeria flavescens]
MMVARPTSKNVALTVLIFAVCIPELFAIAAEVPKALEVSSGVEQPLAFEGKVEEDSTLSTPSSRIIKTAANLVAFGLPILATVLAAAAYLHASKRTFEVESASAFGGQVRPDELPGKLVDYLFALEPRFSLRVGDLFVFVNTVFSGDFRYFATKFPLEEITAAKELMLNYFRSNSELNLADIEDGDVVLLFPPYKPCKDIVVVLSFRDSKRLHHLRGP